MKNNRILAILFVLFVGASASAQTMPKFGYTNVDYILSQLPDSKRIESELKTHRSQLETTLQNKYKDFEGKAKDYQTNGASMSEIIRKDKEKELQNLQSSIQEFERNSEESLQKKQKTLLEPVLEKIQKAIKEVAKENEFAYVLNSDAGYGTTPILLHAPESDNISDLVLKKMGVTPTAKTDAPTNPATPNNTAEKAPGAKAATPKKN
ncbi:MAG: OmpH family outer membrane protein [Ferruginibacter sp.]|nr:OmpH family outer membrane protein [Cytophagales bacterium]